MSADTKPKFTARQRADLRLLAQAANLEADQLLLIALGALNEQGWPEVDLAVPGLLHRVRELLGVAWLVSADAGEGVQGLGGQGRIVFHEPHPMEGGMA